MWWVTNVTRSTRLLGLKNEEIKDNFTSKGLKEAEEKPSIMKLPEDEQKAYEHYQKTRIIQASMFESSFGDGYSEAEGINETTKNIAISLRTCTI